MPCHRKKEFQRHTAAMSAGLTTACRFPVKKKKQNGEKREEKSRKERPDTKSDEGKDKQGREIPAKGKRRGKKQTGRREGKDEKKNRKTIAKNPPREKAGKSQCRTAKTTTGEQQQTGKREKTGKKANRTAGKATKATTDEGKFRFCHSPLAALPQAAIFFRSPRLTD